ncbi:ATP-binding cassette domain-containing protein [Bacillus ndiopicus]|uniref:ATP-binding cassette domain-containing protein n=1 Tax=Bacillus ndiopicus TaxID=1347368 RepID=UPI0005AB72EE|nr:ABC transporter ATP-binding protein [Bacillus ndiopicus]
MANMEAKNLSLNYGQHLALQNISFELEGNKIYGLLGRNGAGKTSLLSIIASFQKQSDGTLTILGQAPFENAEIMQQVVFAYNKNYKEESEKVINLLKGIAKYRPNFDMEYAEHLIARFKIPHDKKMKQLSKGMQAAFDAIIGLASNAPITIFDEIYAGMDAPTRTSFYEELLKSQEQFPRMIIMSTHLVSEMEYLFDEVLILHTGKMLLHEEYDTLVSKGVTVTGRAEDVDAFVQSMRQLSTQQLGSTKAVRVYGDISEQQYKDAAMRGLEIGPITLQDLFIYLTEEGND